MKEQAVLCSSWAPHATDLHMQPWRRPKVQQRTWPEGTTDHGEPPQEQAQTRAAAHGEESHSETKDPEDLPPMGTYTGTLPEG